MVTTFDLSLLIEYQYFKMKISRYKSIYRNTQTMTLYKQSKKVVIYDTNVGLVQPVFGKMPFVELHKLFPTYYVPTQIKKDSNMEHKKTNHDRTTYRNLHLLLAISGVLWISFFTHRFSLCLTTLKNVD
jgi:hypothetical protein